MSKIKVLGYFGFLAYFQLFPLFLRLKIEVWRCNQRDLKINDGINVKNRQSERAIPKKVVSLQRKV